MPSRDLPMEAADSRLAASPYRKLCKASAVGCILILGLKNVAVSRSGSTCCRWWMGNCALGSGSHNADNRRVWVLHNLSSLWDFHLQEGIAQTPL